ncbi:2-octaprenyl-6-methoxyphenyl hydroxylase [Methylopila jiangsuensis]|uniref:2-octaprenyl-6-methoxyphenyl hydroxylase n=1 Tax=Methylopila jiangsuensis TaxID=586230 RepID=A0A9W6N272_9HYPH|nr:FAD-dependent monooxygenase [Methylopila jiangsuensis]MDR6285866.1 2-octaprenyl-6-methoxyphenol hydroxylase [Methylopila jiangsuensis]GLK75624.1 2-octaprenyl-6-methoxyphenyl hydroxylase [Methylopila jiangsuensis]
MTETTSDVTVVGAGPAGLLAALLTARTGARTTLIAPKAQPDSRTTALLDRSIAILREAGVWAEVADASAPLRKLRIVDGGRRLIRTPEVTFDSAELGLEAFGWNVPNVALVAALERAAEAEPGLSRIESPALESRPGPDAVVIRHEGGAVASQLAIAADGRRSLLREAARIALDLTPQNQTALAFSIAHSSGHHDVSTEFQCEEGPCVLVPMPGGFASSVVWVVTPERAEALRAEAPTTFAAELTRRTGRLLGDIRLAGPIGAFPVEVGSATRLAARRTLLVGEAGHVLPPIGAQGLNLGVRDAAAAARQTALARAEGRDPGDAGAMAGYERDRAGDVHSRTLATDLLNRSLLSVAPPVHLARGIGLTALAAIGPLRRFVMRQGVGG